MTPGALQLFGLFLVTCRRTIANHDVRIRYDERDTMLPVQSPELRDIMDGMSVLQMHSTTERVTETPKLRHAATASAVPSHTEQASRTVWSLDVTGPPHTTEVSGVLLAPFGEDDASPDARSDHMLETALVLGTPLAPFGSEELGSEQSLSILTPARWCEALAVGTVLALLYEAFRRSHARRAGPVRLAPGGAGAMLPAPPAPPVIMATQKIPTVSKAAGSKGTAALPTRSCVVQDVFESILHAGLVEVRFGHLRRWCPCRLQLRPGRVVLYNLVGQPEILEQLYLDKRIFTHAHLTRKGGRCVEISTGGKSLTFRCEKTEDAEQWIAFTCGAVEEAAERCQRAEWSFVYVNVYDLGHDWKVRLLNNVLQDVFHMGGIFHTGVEAYGREYMFGGAGDEGCCPNDDATGVTVCLPRMCPHHTLRSPECVGITGISKVDTEAILQYMGSSWLASTYRLFGPNCLTFSRALCHNLGVEAPPAWVDSLAQQVGARYVLEKPQRGGAVLAGGAAKMLATTAQSAVSSTARCPQGHACALQKQGFIASLVEGITCDVCQLELIGRQAHWYCEECNYTICRMCREDCCPGARSSRHCK